MILLIRHGKTLIASRYNALTKITQQMGGEVPLLSALYQNLQEWLLSDSWGLLQGADNLVLLEGDAWNTIQTNTATVTEYKEELVRKLIERITVFDDYILVEFKSGVETEIKM